MKNIKVSELFYSLQGEGRYVGTPSVFLRTFGCNFKCEGFGMPAGEKSNARCVVNPGPHFKTLHDLPLVVTGCDSYGSWDPRFKNLSPKIPVEQLAKDIVDLLPNKQWEKKDHIVITGGEPLLGWQRSYMELFEQPELEQLYNITFETNGTQQLTGKFALSMYNKGYNLWFSVSPKLSASGEAWDDAIQPEIVANYQNFGNVYLKFVCDTEEHVEEALRAVAAYKDAGLECPVYIMPTGGMQKEYQINAPKIAELCMKHKLLYSPRLHVDLFGNAWAT